MSSNALKKKYIVVIYGRGGHQEEMSRLLRTGIIQSSDGVNLVSFTDSKKPLDLGGTTIQFGEFRDKYSWIITLLRLPVTLVKLVYYSFWVGLKYRPVGVITTGPGLAIVPFIIFRFMRIPTAAFESWAKFYEPSLSGRLLSKFSSLFFVQHESMLAQYPKAIYRGRL